MIGSSTALLAVLRNDELRLANMGDCCCSFVFLSVFCFSFRSLILFDLHAELFEDQITFSVLKNSNTLSTSPFK